MGRLEGQHLAVLFQQGLDFGQRRAGARRQDQFGGIVVDDAAMPANCQCLAPIGRRLGSDQKVLGASADKSEWPTFGECPGDLLGK